jgi:hypothetical protein
MDIRIECAHDGLVETASLRPNPRNPNKHPRKQIALLAKIIQGNGWRNPIVVSNRSGYVVNGHARQEAARLLGLATVPVDYQEYENDAAETADMLGDNRIAELAEPDFPALKDLLQDLDTGAFDMDLTGFDDKALEDLMTWTSEPVAVKQLDSRPPPAMTWVLVGIPTTRFGEVAEYVEKVAALEGAIVESCVSDAS